MTAQGRTARFVSEAAVIVVSILLAFSIDAWWDDRQARMTEAAVLEAIREEAEENRIELDRLMRRTGTQLDRIDAFLGATPAELRALPQDSVAPWIAAMVVTWTFDGDDSAAGLFLGSSAPVTRHGRDARIVLARWVRIQEDMEEEKATVWALGVDLAGRVTPHVAAVPHGGQGLLFEVAGRLGPELLAQLRRDDDFVAVTLNKAHYQNVYVQELTQASAVLDSLRAVVRDDPRTLE
ncbi:MAG TPA: hypothetical protein VK858_04430 [Longimicrobiales bacterium]|nr:hypothetical protein [Longimicrobiales bacterium]